MMALSVTPLVEDEGAVEAEGVAVPIRGRLDLSYATLRQMVVAFMALITMKWGGLEKETEKWWKIGVIA